MTSSITKSCSQLAPIDIGSNHSDAAARHNSIELQQFGRRPAHNPGAPPVANANWASRRRKPAAGKGKQVSRRELQRSRAEQRKKSAAAIKSPYNKALVQTDPLFHLYLICVGLITLSILAIKCLIPGMPIYTHTLIGFAFIMAIILGSTIYTQLKTKKINAQFRILLWLIISASLTMLQLVDLIVPDELDSLNLDAADISRTDSLNCAFTWYYTFTIIVAMTATSIFIRINVWLKFIIHLATIMFYIIINNPPATMMDALEDFLQTQSNNWSLLDHKQELSHLCYISMIAVILHLIDRQVEYILSLNIQWNEQLESDRIESETVREINRILLENILPPHVLKRYLYNATVSYDQLYHESHPSCAVMFASIPNYDGFYSENHINEQGLKCLQLLNEVICVFDQLLSYPPFRTIEKIKTIGSTYMAACFQVTRRTSDCTLQEVETPQLQAPLDPATGKRISWPNQMRSPSIQSRVLPSDASTGSPAPVGLSGRRQQAMNNVTGVNGDCGVVASSIGKQSTNLYSDEISVSNVVTIVSFAAVLMESLAEFNRDAFQEFRLRIGIAIGPVIAGVVGATKPTYDIWGDTVNVASRLESSGVMGRIQVSEQVAQVLMQHGQFEVECRGPIEVKGKGKLTTYLVVTPYDSFDSDDGGQSMCSPIGGNRLRPLGSRSDLEEDYGEIMEEPPPTLESVGDAEVEELGASD